MFSKPVSSNISFKSEYSNPTAYEVSTGKLITTITTDENGNAINIYTYGSNFTENVILPSTLNGHKVISIGNSKSIGNNTIFYKSSKEESHWDNIISITVPEGVQYINTNAFLRIW